jgi:hypothetical protein
MVRIAVPLAISAVVVLLFSGCAASLDGSLSLDEPLIVEVAADSISVPYGSSATFTASILNDPGQVVYVWYRDAEPIADGSVLATDPSLAPGYYRIDLLAYTADGRRAGSSTQELRVLPAEDS